MTFLESDVKCLPLFELEALLHPFHLVAPHKLEVGHVSSLVVITGGKEAGERVRALRDVHIFQFIEKGPLMQNRVKYFAQIFIFFGS